MNCKNCGHDYIMHLGERKPVFGWKRLLGKVTVEIPCVQCSPNKMCWQFEPEKEEAVR